MWFFAFLDIMNRKVLQTFDAETETGLIVYDNTCNQIYLTCGSLIEIDDEQGIPIYSGFTILTKDDAIALRNELTKLIKSLQ